MDFNNFGSEDINEQVLKMWHSCVSFHGSECRNLAIGVRVCETVLRHLQLDLSDRTRVVCVSESDGCAIDAIQVCLGSTIGKKHLLFFNTGKLVFTVFDLKSDQSIRVCTRPEVANDEICHTIPDILMAPEETLFYFEPAHPLTPRTLEKVNKNCKSEPELPPERYGNYRDSIDLFYAFDDPNF